MTTGTYLKPEPAKRKIYMGEINDDQREWLKDVIPRSNRQVESDMSDSITAFPTDENSDMYIAFADCAAAWFKYEWAIFNSDKDGMDAALAQYKAVLAGLKTRAKSQPDTNRTPALMISSDPRDQKMILPTQSMIFTFDNYA